MLNLWHLFDIDICILFLLPQIRIWHRTAKTAITFLKVDPWDYEGWLSVKLLFFFFLLEGRCSLHFFNGDFRTSLELALEFLDGNWQTCACWWLRSKRTGFQQVSDLDGLRELLWNICQMEDHFVLGQLLRTFLLRFDDVLLYLRAISLIIRFQMISIQSLSHTLLFLLLVWKFRLAIFPTILFFLNVIWRCWNATWRC